MPKRLAYDRVLFTVTLILVAFGLVMVFSASAMVSMERSHSPYFFLFRQLIGAAIGLALMWGLMRLDYGRLNTPLVVYPALLCTIAPLVLVFFLARSHNAHRWILLGPISLQPSELAKPTLILFLAWYLASRCQKLDNWRLLRPILVYLALVCGLVLLEPDLGTTLALAMIAAVMLFIAGLRWRYFALGALLSAPVLYWAVFRVPYRRERILAFLHPWAHAEGVGFQIVQSLIAVGSGGLTGLGLMDGRQKLFFLPEPHTDFIFAVTSEELGLIGAVALVLLFALFMARGMRVARRAPDAFGKLLAAGITAMIAIEALINFSVVIGLMPTKGIALPFISYGSSSLIATLAATGVLLNISQHCG
jgi:cell division protein FtsW